VFFIFPVSEKYSLLLKENANWPKPRHLGNYWFAEMSSGSPKKNKKNNNKNKKQTSEFSANQEDTRCTKKAFVLSKPHDSYYRSQQGVSHKQPTHKQISGAPDGPT
jgi:hypothetical protein